MNELDRIVEHALETERTVDPSPFFVSRVMTFVRAAAVHPPLPFPARRFVAALALLVVILVRGAVIDPPFAFDLALAVCVVAVTIVAFMPATLRKTQPPAR